MTEYKKVSQEEIIEMIEKHSRWLRGIDGGERANFYGMDLQGVDFSSKLLSNALFDACNLDGANFNRAFIDDAIFTGSSLSDVSFVGAFALFAIFRFADLRGAFFTRAKVCGADFAGANLFYTSFDGADVRDAVFEGAEFEGTRFRGTIGHHDEVLYNDEIQKNQSVLHLQSEGTRNRDVDSRSARRNAKS